MLAYPTTNSPIDRLQFVLNAANIGTWDLDIANQQVWWDDRCKQMYGFHQDDVVPYEQVLQYMHPDDAQRVDTAVRWALEPQSGGHYDVQFRTVGASDGQLRWLHCRGQAYFNEQGEAYRFSGIAQEVTQLIQTHQQLDRSEARFEDLVTATPAATAVFVGRDMLIQQVNAPMLAIWGKGTSVIGKTLHVAIPELEGQPFLDQLQHVFDTGEPFRRAESLAELIEDGQPKTVWFNHAYNPLYNKEGGIYGVINTAIDVTAQVIARRQLMERERVLQNAIDLAQLGTWTVSAETGDTLLSQRHAAMFGLATTTLPYEQALAVVHPDDRERVKNAFLAAMQPGSGGRYEAEYRVINAQTGQQQLIHAMGETTFDGQGKPVHITGTTQDITLERELQLVLENQVQQRTQELQLANTDLLRSNENLEQFAYIASHDLQEPLRKIQSFGDLLRMQYGEVLGDGLVHLQRMQAAASRLSLLVKDLLTFSRISTSQVTEQPVALNELVNQALESLSVAVEESGAHIQVADLPTVQGSALQLGQLFQNLLSNALKFRRISPTGQPAPHQITVRASMLPVGELPAYVKPARYAPLYHRIDVIDNGVGFEQKYTDRIFQVFQRLHGKNEFAGTGVGLAIVQKVVTNHGGAIAATSQPNQGATFSVYLPA